MKSIEDEKGTASKLEFFAQFFSVQNWKRWFWKTNFLVNNLKFKLRRTTFLNVAWMKNNGFWKEERKKKRIFAHFLEDEVVEEKAVVHFDMQTVKLHLKVYLKELSLFITMLFITCL